MYYKTITGLKETLSKPSPARKELQLDANAAEESSVDLADNSNYSETESESETDEGEENSDEEKDSSPETDTKVPIDKKTARKENKKKVKEEKREARKNKVPKAVKKRKKKLAKAHKTRQVYWKNNFAASTIQFVLWRTKNFDSSTTVSVYLSYSVMFNIEM